MDPFVATMIAEGQYELAGLDGEPDIEVIREAWQTLVDTGLAWRLQGWFGRQAQGMIEQGFIIAPKKAGHDG